MKRMILGMIFLAGVVQAACTVAPDGALNVGWEAYKTAAKAGVKGGFASTVFEFEGSKAAGSVKELLAGSRMTIDTTTVDSKNPGRDATLVASFFAVMTGKTISGKVVAVDDTKKVVTVAITMNGVTRDVPMHYSATESEVTGGGYIDLADFSALPALKSINKACYDLHQGKTWQDVALTFTLPIQSVCD